MGLFGPSNADFKNLREDILAHHKTIHTKLHQIIMNQAELAAALKALKEQADKVAVEQGARADAHKAEIDRLTALLAAGGAVTEEVVACLNAVQATFAALDDSIPDPVVAPVV